MHRSVIVLTMLFAITVGATLVASRGASDEAALRYVALGDSVASGNAVDAFPADPCLRGSEGYPVTVQDELNGTTEIAFHHLACSGARVLDTAAAIDQCTAQLTATYETPPSNREDCQLKSLHHQVTTALDIIEDTPTLVTITIGANDTSWTAPLTILGLLLSPDQIFQSEIERITDDVGRELAVEIDRLLVNDQVTVILTDYYNPLNSESNLYDLIRSAQATAWGADNVGIEPCTGTDRDGTEHRLTCAERFAYVLDELNTALASQTALDSERVLLASINKHFQGHEAPASVCGTAVPASGESWIRGLVTVDGIERPDCFHPNGLGANAIAATVLNMWTEQTNRK